MLLQVFRSQFSRYLLSLATGFSGYKAAMIHYAKQHFVPGVCSPLGSITYKMQAGPNLAAKDLCFRFLPFRSWSNKRPEKYSFQHTFLLPFPHSKGRSRPGALAHKRCGKVDKTARAAEELTPDPPGVKARQDLAVQAGAGDNSLRQQGV